MKNKQSKYIAAYNPQDIVFAISLERQDLPENPTDVDIWESNYAKIRKVRIEEVSITKSKGIEYYVQEIEKPEYIWDLPIPQVQVSKDKEVLIKFLFKLWKI